MDQQFLGVLEKLGYSDLACNKLIFGECVPELTKPGEKEFLEMLRSRLEKEEDISVADIDALDFAHGFLSTSEKYKMMTAFTFINIFKALRFAGIRLGPEFIDYLQFPFWRSRIWNTPKVPKGWGFIGITQTSVPDAKHPFDYARSTRYNGCMTIRETPDPELLISDDFEKHHKHGIKGFASMATISFIDIDSTRRVFRYYCIQGCSRLYTYDELENDPHTFECLKAKIVVKGRIPRTKDFVFTTREGWECYNKPIIKQAQHRILTMMANLAPLLPIKMSLAQVAQYCIMDVAPISVAQFLDGRTGMSYGFLAFQLPSGPVESCTEVKVLCTRSGCDKQNPHENNDWVVLSCSTDNLYLNQAAQQEATSPSFDSWLILAQASANVALAKRFKEAGMCSRFVDAIENQGQAICHFHGYIDRSVVPKNMGFYGHDQLPLPCGSVEAAYLTVREKRSIGEKVLACEVDLDYMGDVHVEPDHGSVVSTGFEELEELTNPRNACYGLSNFKTYEGLVWDPTTL